MTPLELIDQILSKPKFSCSKKQMEFLRDLIIQQQDPQKEAASRIHYLKKCAGGIRREITFLKSSTSKHEEELKDILFEMERLQGMVIK